jgi:hypothetical protein
MFVRPSRVEMEARLNAPTRAATILEMLEAEGASLRFLRAFAEEPRPVRRLVVRWLALGWPGGGRR